MTQRILYSGKTPVAELLPVSSDKDREAWLAARQSVLTASDVATVLGLRGSRVSLFYEKHEGLRREFTGNEEAADMGHALEPLNAQLYKQKTGRPVMREQHLARSIKYPFLGATLDYWTSIDGKRAPLELKSTAWASNWPDDEKQVFDETRQRVGQPDLCWQVQLQSQMIVVDAEVGSLSAVLGQPNFRHRWDDFPAHEKLSALIIEKCEEFWDMVQRGVPPAVDGSDECKRTLQRLNRVAAKEAELSGAIEQQHEELDDVKKQLSELKKREQLLQNQIVEALGDAEIGLLPDGTGYTYRETHRQAYTVDSCSYRQLRFTTKPRNKKNS